MNPPTLLHLADAGPVGIWRLEDDTPVSYYPNDSDQKWRTRAEQLLNARGNNVPWDDWFHQLAERSPYLDNYILVDTDPQEPLAAAYQRCRNLP